MVTTQSHFPRGTFPVGRREAGGNVYIVNNPLFFFDQQPVDEPRAIGKNRCR